MIATLLEIWEWLVCSIKGHDRSRSWCARCGMPL